MSLHSEQHSKELADMYKREYYGRAALIVAALTHEGYLDYTQESYPYAIEVVAELLQALDCTPGDHAPLPWRVSE